MQSDAVQGVGLQRFLGGNLLYELPSLFDSRFSVALAANYAAAQKKEGKQPIIFKDSLGI